MSFDLTNKNIQDTFQNLLQQTGSTGEVYDLEGNQVTNININTISSSIVTASIVEVPNSSNQGGNKLHARSGVLYFGDTNLETGGGGISNIVEDSTPQLGGDLDLNSNNITGNGRMFLQGAASINTATPATNMALTVAGDISASGNVFADGFVVGPQGTTRAGTTALTVAGDISGSGLEVTTDDTNDFFLLKSGSLDSLKVNGQGVLVLGGFTFEPTAIKGGLYYNDNDDEFYAGKDN
tara:strand:- start:964 stop:1677 length:714 start_codon:yes stop_codon:yes gene_type:complete